MAAVIDIAGVPTASRLPHDPTALSAWGERPVLLGTRPECITHRAARFDGGPVTPTLSPALTRIHARVWVPRPTSS